MAELKGAAADRFVKRPDRTMVLLYGTDRGLILERGGLVASAFAGREGEVVRLTLGKLADDPGRLADEAGAISLFGGRRALRIDASSPLPDLAALLADPPSETLMVFEKEGMLKASDKMRKAFETAPGAVAIACYPDRAGDVTRVLDAELEAAGLTATAEARARIVQVLGGDRGATREEIRKLCLYAHGRTEVTLEDVEAIVDDAGASGLNVLCELTAGGEIVGADRRLMRLLREGVDAGVVALMLLRHMALLHRLCAGRDAGTPIDAAVRALRPPVFGERAEAIRTQARIWSTEAAARAMERLQARSLDIRRNASLGPELIGLEVSAIAEIASRRRGL